MDKNDNYYIRIPRPKQSFYKRLEFPKDTNKDIRKLIRLVNYLQKWGKVYQNKKKK